jgi:drug/metabolite transporter (DMT)-like permease
MSFGLGEFFSVLCAFLWAVAVIAYRKAGEGFDSYEINLFKIGLSFLLFAFTLLAWQWHRGDFSLPELSWQALALIVLSGVLGTALADMFYVRALQLIGAGLTGLTGSLYSPMVVLLSMLWLGEFLLPLQWLGMALVMSGVLIISWRRSLKNSLVQHPPIRGFVYAALGVFFTAVGIVIIKPVTTEVPFLWLMVLRMAGGLVAIVLYGLYKGRSLSVRHVWHSPMRWWLLWGAFLGQYLSMMVWVAGYKYTSASVASILNETASVFILLLSWALLGETITRRKVLGMLISLAGVALVLLAH